MDDGSELSVSAENWILAFDASCGRCRTLSGLVATQTTGKVEVLPLSHGDVQRWRRTALGPEAPWAPTLIRVRAPDDVAAWTGLGLGVRLVRRLGLRDAVGLLRSLGTLPRSRNEHLIGNAQADRALTRPGFLRLGLGLLAAGSLLAGRTPAALAATPDGPDAWLRANRGRLPQSYDEFVKYPLSYRRRIFAVLQPDVRRRLWITQLERYRRTHPDLTVAQRDTIDRGLDLLRGPIGALVASDRTKSVESNIIATFGLDEARLLAATLGPDDNSPQNCQCTCSTESDFCAVDCLFDAGHCNRWTGCGLFWIYECNGMCGSPEGC